MMQNFTQYNFKNSVLFISSLFVLMVIMSGCTIHRTTEPNSKTIKDVSALSWDDLDGTNFEPINSNKDIKINKDIKKVTK